MRPLYNRQKTISLSVDVYNSNMTGVGYEVNHVSGDGFVWSTTTTYYHGDHLTSSRLITTVSGYPTWSGTFLPFGQEWNPQITVNNYKFTGDERDAESQLDHTQFRQYSSSLGRWSTPDPADFAAANPTNPQSWNRYAYVGNDPMDYADAFGLDPCQGANVFAFSQAADGTGIFDPEDCALNGGTWGNGLMGGGGGGGQAPGLAGDPMPGCTPAPDSDNNQTGVAGTPVCPPTNYQGGGGGAATGVVKSVVGGIKNILRSYGNHILVPCGGGGFAYLGSRVSAGLASVSFNKMFAYDTSQGKTTSYFTDLTLGEAYRGGYGYAAPTSGKGSTEHFFFNGVGADLWVFKATASSFLAHTTGSSIFQNSQGINLDIGYGRSGAGIGSYVNMETLTACAGKVF